MEKKTKGKIELNNTVDVSIEDIEIQEYGRTQGLLNNENEEELKEIEHIDIKSSTFINKDNQDAFIGTILKSIRIIAEKQLTRMKGIGELLSKAKKVNKSTEKNDIFYVDDILVEMAILQMSKSADEWVFYFKCLYQGKKWTIRKTFDQVKVLHNSFSFKPKTILPNFCQTDNLLYLRVAKYLMNIKQEVTLKKDIQRLILFMEATYNIMDANIMGEVIKCGWARKKIGGRYKGNQAWNYIKTSLNCCWKRRFFILTEEGIGYTNKMGDNDFRDVLMFDHTLRVRVGIHYTEEKFGIVLYTSSRRLKIKVNSSYELADWIEAIADSINKSPYCK